MIVEVDRALEGLLRDALPDGIDVSFLSPAQIDAGSGEGSVLDLHLLDLREEVAMKTAGIARTRDDDGHLVAFEAPTRWYRLSYWVTAWAADASREHEVLGQALAVLAGHDSIPREWLAGDLLAAERPVRLEVAMPPAVEDFAVGIWSSLRLPMKGALHLAVLAPVPGVAEPAGPDRVVDRHLRLTGPPPKRPPALTPAPGVPAALVGPPGVPPSRPVGGPPPKPSPTGPPTKPPPTGPPTKPPPTGPPSKPPPVAAPAEQPDEDAPERPKVIEEVIYGPEPGMPPRTPE